VIGATLSDCNLEAKCSMSEFIGALFVIQVLLLIILFLSNSFVQTSNATTSNQNQALNHHSAAAAPAAGGLGLSSPQQDQLGLMDSQHDGFERDDVIEQVGSGYDNVTAVSEL